MSFTDTYTRIFINRLGYSENDLNVKQYKASWWKNTRSRTENGLRLTGEGYRMMQEDLDIAFYEIPYADNMVFTPQVLVWLDNFIDCPYYLDKKSMFVADDKKALELHMFSGDMQKFGVAKALSRQGAK